MISGWRLADARSPAAGNVREPRTCCELAFPPVLSVQKAVRPSALSLSYPVLVYLYRGYRFRLRGFFPYGKINPGGRFPIKREFSARHRRLSSFPCSCLPPHHRMHWGRERNAAAPLSFFVRLWYDKKQRFLCRNGTGRRCFQKERAHRMKENEPDWRLNYPPSPVPV